MYYSKARCKDFDYHCRMQMKSINTILIGLSVMLTLETVSFFKMRELFPDRGAKRPVNRFERFALVSRQC